jgi:SAM-dependent methyltransferase
MNRKTEHAIYISDPVDLKYFNNSPFDRIYFGSEFCEFLLPTVEQIAEITSFASREGVRFTFVTPPCTERALAEAIQLIEMLPDDAEVVFSDWGLLEAILAAKKTPVHGRLLCNAKKDPRLGHSQAEPEYATGHNIQSAYQKMLIGNNVTRVELDNVFQGLIINPENRMKFSLYYPFVPCTMTRKCYFANMAAGNVKFRPITECAIHCRGKNIALANSGEKLYVKGNAQYYVNSTLPAETGALGIDRYVYMPVFPNHNFTTENILYLDWNRLFEKFSLKELWGDTPDECLSELSKQIWNQYSDSPQNIIDIGCGTGRHAALFADENYYGIDISHNAIETARENENGVFIHGDILDFKGYGEFFHKAVDSGCFHAIPPHKRRRYFESVHGIINRGGLLLLCAWHSEDSVLPVFFVADQMPEWGSSLENLRDASNGYFEIQSYRIVPFTERNMLYAVLKRL